MYSKKNKFRNKITLNPCIILLDLQQINLTLRRQHRAQIYTRTCHTPLRSIGRVEREVEQLVLGVLPQQTQHRAVSCCFHVCSCVDPPLSGVCLPVPSGIKVPTGPTSSSVTTTQPLSPVSVV